ncbi:hypothetical protein QP71_00020, partial [Staphylococcus aureus]
LALKSLVEGKQYHIITTNADNAFDAAEYDMTHVFHIQGEYILPLYMKYMSHIIFSSIESIVCIRSYDMVLFTFH